MKIFFRMIVGTCIITAGSSLASNKFSDNFENLPPRNFISLKEIWDGEKYSEQTKKDKKTLTAYVEVHPHLLDKVSEQLSSNNKSFIIKQDLNGDPDY